MVDGLKDFKFVVADDDIEQVRLRRDMIREFYPESKIYEFINGFEAYAFLEAKSLVTFQPDQWVVISDFYMPIKKGDEVMQICERIGIDKKCIVSSASDLEIDVKTFKKHKDDELLREWISQL